jgi:hypothetical protein
MSDLFFKLFNKFLLPTNHGLAGRSIRHSLYSFLPSRCHLSCFRFQRIKIPTLTIAVSEVRAWLSSQGMDTVCLIMFMGVRRGKPMMMEYSVHILICLHKHSSFSFSLFKIMHTTKMLFQWGEGRQWIVCLLTLFSLEESLKKSNRILNLQCVYKVGLAISTCCILIHSPSAYPL